MDERHSDVPTTRASYLPPPVRRSVIPRAADAVELIPRGPMSAPVARPARPLVAALALLLVGAAALGLRALPGEAPTPAPTVTRAVVRARPAPPTPVVAPPAAPPIAEAAAAVEQVTVDASVERRRARRHHRHHRALLASAARSAYTLILLP
jgi:hypothetical protein